ncbi:MAG: bifunctional diaminohydroxyphosphoribosylaminopyrimidine deaminase/5-amino-6-(5-phosphoribosylamino)uracil reductase RibD, partial [Deltaproteobacteria bacterium]|nr:bifunctional diaminohydroxyphosphoribosylaminopyrimidine deaminase/5-amino-6-(5-phosphoribosylamino)uracil reductase RibD [Deltaproteobacteria bacterium]
MSPRSRAATAATAATAADEAWMREALRLAARARGRTAPNPMVGGVVVRGSRRIASGYHARLGGLHGEASALRNARGRARGATLYVNLEPCAHHGRQPPCVDAVLEAGVARVVVGLRDPDPRTAGRSIRRLRSAGVEVTVGVEEDACRELNRGFRSRVERGRPFTTLKLAASLDGRIATASGESRWITGTTARGLVHAWRRGSDAVAVGSGTAIADDPELTARERGRVVHRPVRVLVDSGLRVGAGARIFRSRGRALVLTTRAAPARAAARLEAAGAELLRVRARGGRIDLAAGWQALGRAGLNDLLVEGGGGLAAALLRSGLVDELRLFLAPVLIGGDGREVLESLGVRRLASAPRLELASARRVGEDLLL